MPFLAVAFSEDLVSNDIEMATKPVRAMITRYLYERESITREEFMKILHG